MKPLRRIFQLALLPIAFLSFSRLVCASDLEKEMDNIYQNSKILKISVGDPAKKADALAAIGQMIKSAEAAETMTPRKIASIPEADSAQFIADYKKQIDGLIEQFKKIEADINAGKPEDAKADFAKVNDIKREGHKEFASKT